MQSIEILENNYADLTQDDLFDVTGDLAIAIDGVTLVLTAKGLAMAGALIGGSYTDGYAIVQGWTYIQN